MNALDRGLSLFCNVTGCRLPLLLQDLVLHYPHICTHLHVSVHLRWTKIVITKRLFASLQAWPNGVERTNRMTWEIYFPATSNNIAFAKPLGADSTVVGTDALGKAKYPGRAGCGRWVLYRAKAERQGSDFP